MAVKAMRYSWQSDVLAGLVLLAILLGYIWLACRYW